MTPFHLALRSLAYHWRTNAAVALGVMAATAVLTGALVVGDSVRGSLRRLAIDRLGRIDAALVTPNFFREKLAAEVAAAPEIKKHFAAVVPAIMLQGTLENPTADGNHHHRAGNVAVLGTTPEFWNLGRGGPAKPPTGDEIVLNVPLADQLHAKVGDEVILRLPQASDVPADSPLGRKTDTVRSRRLTVSAIIPAEGLGRFGLNPTQQTPLDAFTSIEPLQRMLSVTDRVNAILVAGGDETEIPDSSADQALEAALKPTSADYGISIHKTDRGYFNITTDRMLFEPTIQTAVIKALGELKPQCVFTYLANYITANDGKGKIPYSTVAAVTFSDQPPLGPLVNREGQPIPPLADDEIVLNSWAADDLAAQGLPVQPGDEIEITYFKPESAHGKVEQAMHNFRLKDVAELSGAAADRNLTPEVKGVTDEASIADWNPPFPYDPKRVRSTPPHNEDDLYWKQYRATPKAFISFTDGTNLWNSRFGGVTSIRVPVRDGMTEQSLAEQLQRELHPPTTGFKFLPVKRLSLTAAAGTTPFAVLFLGFSMFIIAAALMLVMLLFKLGVESRAAELGIVLAVGLQRSVARKMLLIEGAMITAVGALAGILAGVAYAWLMIVGLKTWWLSAISTPFLNLYVTLTSLLAGYFCGVVVSLATIVWALRQTRRVSVRRLLAGQMDEGRTAFRRRGKMVRWIAIGMFSAALLSGVFGGRLANEAQTGAFFGAGALVLTALLLWIWDALRADRGSLLVGGHAALARLAIRNGGRFPLRSTLTIGLMAAACFLIIAVSAFSLDPPSQGPTFDSGDGGFALVAQSDQPIYQDLNSSDGRQSLAFTDKSEQLLAGTDRPAPTSVRGHGIYPLRVKSGDDASCLNLYQPRQPRILGVTPDFTKRGGFVWAATAAANEAEQKNPWLLLIPKPGNPPKGTSPADAIPVVLDQNTALYSLHLYGGAGETFEIDAPRGGKIMLQVVGLLKNSIFQGDLLISETNFLRLFPDVSGYRYFLIAAPPKEVEPVADALENQLGDYGFTAQSTAARLAGFFAVQNTYLATFRSLGGLGLLLGTFGLATVQLRNVMERRRELALLRAAGFRRSRLAQLVMLENAALLVAGLFTGALAALVVLLPHLLAGGAGIPWKSLAATLAIVLVVGLLAGLSAVQAAVRAPLLATLRGD